MATGRLPDPNTAPLTAKGDLYTYSTVPARLAVGSNGDTLVADSSTTTGLRYNPPVGSLANPVINGGMDIWQRGTSISVAASTSTPVYLADRWCTITAANQAITVSRQNTNDSTNLPNIQFAARYQRNSGQTGTGTLNLLSNLETTNSLPFAGKTVTVSFYARAGANYSAASSALTAILYSGTGTDQNAFVVYTGIATVASATATLTTTWQRFVVNATIGATANELALAFAFTPTGTAGANDWFEITGVQVDVGTYTASTAPTFRRSGGTLAGELAACQRYYYRTTVQAGQHFANGLAQDTTTALYVMPFPVTMRIAPTALEQSGTAADYSVRTGVTNTTCSGVPLFGNASTQNAIFSFTVASGLVTSNALFARPAVNGAYLGWSAEL